MAAFVSTRGLTKRYGGAAALDCVSVKLERGRIYGLVGANGAGKTTLLRLLAGLTIPTAGTMEMPGSEKTGCLIETPVYYDYMDVRQNLRAELITKGAERGRAEDRAEIGRLMRLLSLTGALAEKKNMKKLSLGARQRYGIAAALLGDPELLLLDEPMNGLDPEGMEDVSLVLSEMNREKGTTMLISSHLLSELWQLADSFIFLGGGRLLECPSRKEIQSRLGGEETNERMLRNYYMALIGGGKHA